jgi:hypothetical protein
VYRFANPLDLPKMQQVVAGVQANHVRHALLTPFGMNAGADARLARPR